MRWEGLDNVGVMSECQCLQGLSGRESRDWGETSRARSGFQGLALGTSGLDPAILRLFRPIARLNAGRLAGVIAWRVFIHWFLAKLLEAFICLHTLT